MGPCPSGRHGGLPRRAAWDLYRADGMGLAPAGGVGPIPEGAGTGACLAEVACLCRDAYALSGEIPQGAVGQGAIHMLIFIKLIENLEIVP